MSQLTTFVKPQPSHFLINSLVPVNRLINLKGVKLLHCVPLLNKMPIVRGLCDVTEIDFPECEVNRLKQSVNSETVSFIGPNHPEFYTDWMLDKEVSSLVAPNMASWATHSVVNGMGKYMQKFWLKNNLIAQIPGTGNKEAKEYSINHALKGNAVLLHPEGHVGWHSDKIAPLFSGIVDMAYEAYIRTQGKKNVYMSPVIWKLVFNKDATHSLHKEMDRIEKVIGLENSSVAIELNKRLAVLFKNLFINIGKKYNLHINNNLSVAGVHTYLLSEMTSIARSNLKLEKIALEKNDDIRKAIKELNKFLRDNKCNKEIKLLLRDINKLAEFDFTYFVEELSQENVAELLQKICIQYCDNGLFNKIHKFVPVPVASRTAYIRVPEAIYVNAYIEKYPHLNEKEIKNKMLEKMHENMQMTLDQMNEQLTLSGKIKTLKNTLL